ncbi:hypothetical protein ACFYM2_21195 [Streptomyces sp. NPDC006711]|uniref:hypothetical protein n=1 Tax=Streptomyces sp. NPDC006711 TaxID=3364762 RepID=UPI00368885D7
MSGLNRAVTRLADGATLLGRRLVDRAGAWVRAGRRDDLTGWQASLGCWIRLAVLCAGLWILWRLVRAAPALLWAIAPAVGFAAWRAGRPPRPAAPAAAQAPEPVEEEASPTLSATDLLDHVRKVAGGGRGVHLSVLAQHLTEATGTPWSTADTRAALTAAHVPVRQGVRMPGRTPSTGVRVDDLPPPAPRPSPTPAAGPVGGVVVAGQEAPTGAPTPTPTAPPTADRRRVGDLLIETVDDAQNPARTHVRVLSREPGTTN